MNCFCSFDCVPRVRDIDITQSCAPRTLLYKCLCPPGGPDPRIGELTPGTDCTFVFTCPHMPSPTAHLLTCKEPSRGDARPDALDEDGRTLAEGREPAACLSPASFAPAPCDHARLPPSAPMAGLLGIQRPHCRHGHRHCQNHCHPRRHPRQNGRMPEGVESSFDFPQLYAPAEDLDRQTGEP